MFNSVNASVLDGRTDIIIGDNDGAKINKFIRYIDSIVIGCNLGTNTQHFPISWQHILNFLFINGQTYPSMHTFNGTKDSYNMSLGKHGEVNVVSLLE